jgi:Conserved protein/domain typically associated with flavoprotein oxygenases, DIM6/NTAB family
MSLVNLPLEKAFMLVEPGPVVLVATNRDGRNNLMTISWHMVMDFSPRIALRTGPWNYSFNTILHTRECVLGIPTIDIAEKVVGIGDCSGENIDKFERFGLTPIPALEVKAPLIAECLGCIECRVTEYLEKPGIIILEGLRAWIDPEREERRTFHANGDGTFVADGSTINLRHLMEDKVPSGV